MDEGLFSTETEDSGKEKPLKRGRGSQKKNKVLVMAESRSVEGELPRKVNHIKMIVIEDLKAAAIDKHVKEVINNQGTIDSDSSTLYTNFKKLVQEHQTKVIPKNEVGKALPWYKYY